LFLCSESLLFELFFPLKQLLTFNCFLEFLLEQLVFTDFLPALLLEQLFLCSELLLFMLRFPLKLLSTFKTVETLLHSGNGLVEGDQLLSALRVSLTAKQRQLLSGLPAKLRERRVKPIQRPTQVSVTTADWLLQTEAIERVERACCVRRLRGESVQSSAALNASLQGGA
jgi:hypothetical protein